MDVGNGHTSNPGFSSTSGVQILASRCIERGVTNCYDRRRSDLGHIRSLGAPVLTLSVVK